MISLHGFMTLLSLGLTFPAIVVCVMVLVAWHEQYIEFMQTKDRSPSLILIAGVYIGFWGSMIDNAWWGVAWSFDYIDHPWRVFFFTNGVYPNTLFRQMALIIAGSLHIWAENMARDTKEAISLSRQKTKWSIIGSCLLGMAYVLLLLIIGGK